MAILRKKRKIEKKRHIIRILRKNLHRELRIIRHYEKNIGKFTNKKESSSLRRLAAESAKHAAMFIDAIHRLDSMEKPVPTSPRKEKKKLSVLGNGMREEKGAEDIYRYQAKWVADRETAKMLRSIAKDEKTHQKVVKGLASDSLRKLPKKDAKRILKKYRF
jgi:rubrerythrin